MKIINKSHGISVVVCFLISLIFAASCPAQDTPDELSSAESFEKLSVKIKPERMTSGEVKMLGLPDTKGTVDIDFDGVIYKINFINKSGFEFDDLKVECRFFYTEKSIWRPVQTGYYSSRKGRKEEELKYQEEEFDVRLRPNGREKKETQPFVTQSWAVRSGMYFPDGSADEQDASVAGLWVRVTYTTPDGETLQRDFYDQKSLPSRVTWGGTSI